MWSQGSLDAIKDIKKTVLKRKIILNIIIDSSAWYDRIFRYSHMTIALVSPIIAFVDQLVNGNVERTSTAVLVLSSIVAGMIKLKEYLKFDKLKDQAKQQSVKYNQLVQRIDRELRKTTKQDEEAFISWITRELSIIEVDDPDITTKVKEKFIALCKEKGIPYDEDIAALEDLFRGRNTSDIEIKINQTEEIKDDDLPNTQPNTQPNKTIHRQSSIVSPNDPARIEYRKNIQTLDTSKDLEWAIQRLNDLDS